VGDEFARVRYEAFWLSVCGVALATIVAGYVSGQSSARLPQRAASSHPRPQPSVHAVLRDPSDSSVDDVFSDDDVVVERPALADITRWAQPRLSFVIGLCGYSASEDERFMQLPVPVAIVLDPAAPQAAEVAQLAREAHDLVLVHTQDAPTLAQLTRLRQRLGAFDGIAAQDAGPFAQALDGNALMYFDERGDADGDDFHRLDVPFAQRDVTVDDRTATTYIDYMLHRAVQRSERQGRLVVLMRPRPHSYAALRALADARTVEILPLRQI
jgi:polysaccharide deacetylase 2 family uncharacterized protein YibQ